MTYLFVVAHPDDDVLGAGAFIHKLKTIGQDRTATLVLNSNDDTRYTMDKGDIVRDFKLSSEIIGLDCATYSDFKDSEFHNESHRKMVETIEYMIRKEKPDYIFTHSPSDNNSDHYWCCQAVLEACRLGQRGKSSVPPIKGLYFIEVLSSTDWGINSGLSPFIPNAYIEVDEIDIRTKIKALKVYENVIRPNPFPRSVETIFALSRVRGSQAGYKYAEAFQCVFRRGI